MKLISELNESLEFLTEGEDGNKKLYIKGIFAQAEVVNRNNRIYPISVLENEINRYIKENVTTGSALGELNHPSGPNLNLDRACILIKQLQKNGNDFIGKAAVLNTPTGKIVEGLIEGGARLGVSTRALGSLKPYSKNEGVNEVQDDLRLLAVDVVGDPSAPNAFINGIMEGTEYFYNNQTGAYAEKVKEIIKKLPTKEIEERKLEIFEAFVTRIAKI